MSILMMWQDSYYEPADLIEEEGDDAIAPPELLTAGAGHGWWSASAVLPDLD